MKFHLGQRVRTVGPGVPEGIRGKEGTVVAASYTSPIALNWNGEPAQAGTPQYHVDLDGIGIRWPCPFLGGRVVIVGYEEHELEPLVDDGDWKETTWGKELCNEIHTPVLVPSA